MSQSIKRLRERAGWAPATPRARRGFTLIEALVAIGAVSLLGVAIAAVFEATGRTTSQGRKISEFNAKASLIAGQLERDIRHMTREGFLVIRNELQNGRRCDELVFFAEGDYVSSRPPMAAGFQARAQAARIYYGHGTRRPVNLSPNQNNLYLYPRLNDIHDVPYLGQPAGPGSPNPNTDPLDWSLLRHATLLSPSSNAPTPIVGNPFGPPNPMPTRYFDNRWQVALQPAAFGIFRTFNTMAAPIFPSPAPNATTHLRVFDLAKGRPAFTSGIVDIATMGLPEIRQIAMTASCFPIDNVSNNSKVVTAAFFDYLSNNGSEASNVGLDSIYQSATADPAIIDRLQAWMDDAFPARSNAPQFVDRRRMRYEPAETNLRAALAETKEIDRAALVGDQAALSASVLVPKCSELILEWSRGERYPQNTNPSEYRGQVVWYGMPRQANGQWVALPFAASSNFQLPANPPPPTLPTPLVSSITVPYRTIGGSTATHTIDANVPGPNQFLFHRQSELGSLQNATSGQQLSSYFGYVDPSFNPDTGGKQGVLDAPGDAASPTLAWPWPKLLRVTMTLVDPGDPSIEQTYQWIFEVPEPGKL